MKVSNLRFRFRIILPLILLVIGVFSFSVRADHFSNDEYEGEYKDEYENEYEEEIELSVIDRTIPGKRSGDALRYVLNSENIKEIVGKFKPVHTGLVWDIQSLDYVDQKTHFRIKINGNSSSAQPQAVPTSGLWGYVSGAISGVTQYVSTWMTGDLIGEISQEEIECADPYQKKGLLLNLSLRNSSYVISSQVQGLKVQVCYQEIPSQLKTDIRVTMKLLPGPLFSGLEDKQTFQVVSVQADAWVDALSELIAIQEAGLVRQEFDK